VTISTFSRRYGVTAIALSWSLAVICALPTALDPSTAAIDEATYACAINWRDPEYYAFPTAYLLLGLGVPLTVEAIVYYGI